MEASALPASVALARPRLAFGASLLRIRSDDQLVGLFRDGNEDAFRVIHDRYRSRLHAYTRQMLAGSPHDSEDALQETFMRAYYGLRANRRDLALRPWLYRVAHNRCVDELRRQPLILLDPADVSGSDDADPAARVEQRDALRQLIADVQRLPDQQRSALLMRELSGISYVDVSDALDVSVPAVKSLLVRARVGLAQASEARDTSCAQIREELILAHDRGVRASGLARRHLSECTDCRTFRTEIRGVSRQLAALAPTLGPIGIVANLLGIGGGGGAAAGSSAAVGSSAAAGGAGAAASAGLLAGGGGHVATLLAAAMVTAGGAVELQKTIIAPAHPVRHHAASRDVDTVNGGAPATAIAVSAGLAGASIVVPASSAAIAAARATNPAGAAPTQNSVPGHNTTGVPLTQILDPDHLLFLHISLGPAAPTASSPGTVTPPGPGAAGAPGAGTPGAATPPITPPAVANPSGGPGAPPAGTTPAGSTPTVGSGSAPEVDGSGTSASLTAGSSAPSRSATAPSSGGGSTSSTGQTGGTTGSAPTSRTAAATSGSGTSATSRTGSTVAKRVAAGGTLSSRVITFTVTRRHAPHRFALGTLLPR